VAREGLSNVLLLPYQPRAAFAETLAAADLSLVTLNQRSALASLPSKIFNIMASARPILAVAPLDSEISQLVVDAACGIAIAPEDPQAVAAAILDLQSSPETLVKMGQQGRAQLETQFSRRRCCDLYESMLRKLVSTPITLQRIPL